MEIDELAHAFTFMSIADSSFVRGDKGMRILMQRVNQRQSLCVAKKVNMNKNITTKETSDRHKHSAKLRCSEAFLLSTLSTS